MHGIRMTYYNRFVGESSYRNIDGSMPRIVGNPQISKGRGLQMSQGITNEVASPLDPRGYWGSRGGAEFVPYRNLPGDKTMLPPGAIGYKMGVNSSASTWSGNAYSYSNVGSKSITSGELFAVSVWCYLSPDFNGQWARISCEGSASGTSYYNLSNKGTWQRLRMTVTASGTGSVATYLYWTRSGGTTFAAAGLTGHIIYAAPMFHRLDHHYVPFSEGTIQNQRIEIPVAGNFPGYDGGSAIFFVRPVWAYNAGTGLGYPRLFTVDDPAGARVLAAGFSTGSDSFYIQPLTGGAAVTPSTHLADERIMVAYAWDRDTLKVSLNGGAFVSTSWTPPALGSRVWIGDDMGNPGVRSFNGLFEEVAFLDKPITSRMVSSLYNNIFIPGKNLNNVGYLN